jgi:hypothetical protein
MKNKLLQAAHWYLEQGYSVIPVGNNKKPIIQWIDFQQRRPTHDELDIWWAKNPDANVAIITGEISNLFVLDLDTKEAIDHVEELTPDEAMFPIAVTPRGGQHRYFKCEPGIRNLANIVPGVDVRAEGGYVLAPPSILPNGGYSWMGDLGIHQVELCPLLEEYKTLLDAKRENYTKLAKECGHEVVEAVKFTEGHRDNAIFHLANHLVKSGMPIANIRAYLYKIGAQCDPPFPQEEVEAKLMSATKRADRVSRNLTNEVLEFIYSVSGYFYTADIYSALQLNNRADKKAVVMALKRFKDDEIIEAWGGKAGCYRKVESSCPPIDWMNAEQVDLGISYPLGIDKYFNTMPKNIIIVAGSPDAGKTAFLLNFIKKNMDKHPIHYFSSEMGPLELQSRLLGFEMPLTNWKFDARERACNFEDVVYPNDINIIDFLEISDSFYQIGGMITRIFNKLDKGIAIIAMQKNRGQEMGRGGTFGLEKPRLYLAVDPSYPGASMRIVKCKNWKYAQLNPNGLVCHFSIVRGAKLLKDKEWSREDEND